MSEHDRILITLALVGSILILGGVIGALAVLMWQRFTDRLDATHDRVSAQDVRIADLEKLVDELADRVVDGERHCDGWHDLFSGDRSSVQDLLGRVAELETPAPATPPADVVPQLALDAGPILVDPLIPEEPAFFNQLAAALPALTESTSFHPFVGELPYVPVTGRVAPIDNTETAFTRENVRAVLARLESAEVVDARELAEVAA